MIMSFDTFDNYIKYSERDELFLVELLRRNIPAMRFMTSQPNTRTINKTTRGDASLTTVEVFVSIIGVFITVLIAREQV